MNTPRPPWIGPDGNPSWTAAWMNVTSAVILFRYFIGGGISYGAWSWSPGELDPGLVTTVLSLVSAIYYGRQSDSAPTLDETGIQEGRFLRAPWNNSAGKHSWTTTWLNLALALTLVRLLVGSSLTVLGCCWSPGALTGGAVFAVVAPLATLYWSRHRTTPTATVTKEG